MPIDRRRLMSLALPALATPMLATACASADPVLYTIPVKPGPVLTGGPKIVQLRDIGLASYLDRREIVRSSDGNKLGVSNNDWWGESLGTGVAVALASEKPVTHVILDAPYTSTVDVAADVYWFLPVRLLMKDQFRSDKRIKQVKAPVLILHGDADDIIPIKYGERLLAMVPGDKRLVRFAGGYHGDLDRLGASDEALRFLGAR